MRKSKKETTEEVKETKASKKSKVQNPAVNETVETSEVQKKAPFWKKINVNVSLDDMHENVERSTPAFIVYTLAAFILMGIACLGVFMYANKGYEQVLVPNVVGKSLTRALLEMQDKELYPKLQLRYSDKPGEAGQVLSQDPKGGAIVKAGRRVSLVVSRGMAVDHIENYVGMNLDVLKTKLDTLYGGTDTPMIYIGSTVFKIDGSAPGTILQQDPPEGTSITQPVKLTLVVSSGPSKPVVKVEDFSGMTIAEVLESMSKTKLLFDFTSHAAQEGEVSGTVISQTASAGEELPEYSHVTLDFAFSGELSGDTVVANSSISGRTEDEVAGIRENISGLASGIFTSNIDRYPYAVPVKVDAVPQEGSSYNVATFNHIGGTISVPYAVPQGTTLVLSVVNQEKNRFTVQ